jgi:hypothetical protein
MDRLEKSNSDGEGFVKTVFPFDDSQKESLLNIIQYTLLTIIPIVIILKLIKSYMPEADEDNGSLVIFVEVIAQLLVMFFALYFIHRIVAYIPTYSGKVYEAFSITTTIPVILLLALTMQSKLSEKVQILIDRLMDLYEGQTSSKSAKQSSQGQVRVTQPLSQQYSTQGPPPQAVSPMQNIAAPPPAQMTNNKSGTNEYSIPQTPNFDSMYSGPETPLVNAASPVTEPFAANDFLGGSFGTPF